MLLTPEQIANRHLERITKKHARRIAKNMARTKGDRKLIAKALVKGLIGAEDKVHGQANRLQPGGSREG